MTKKHVWARIYCHCPGLKGRWKLAGYEVAGLVPEMKSVLEGRWNRRRKPQAKSFPSSLKDEMMGRSSPDASCLANLLRRFATTTAISLRRNLSCAPDLSHYTVIRVYSIIYEKIRQGNVGQRNAEKSLRSYSPANHSPAISGYSIPL